MEKKKIEVYTSRDMVLCEGNKFVNIMDIGHGELLSIGGCGLNSDDVKEFISLLQNWLDSHSFKPIKGGD